MDYIEAFKNLNTNNKYSRKSPHKAILLLTIIDLCETNALSENVIYYDDKLKRSFWQKWNQVLRDESLFHPDLYLPYWFMQSEDFWHIVPKKGKEDIVSIMRDEHIKPSESKLIDCVKYAELDDDLFFLMTIPTGRSSLKKALLETYFDLSNSEINKLSESQDYSVDNSVSALSEYEKILKKGNKTNNKQTIQVSKELEDNFYQLNEDLQIVLNLEFYSFLKKHRIEREMFKEVCPTVYDLYDHIIAHPLKKIDLLPSFAIVYMNFLSDLKISLLSEDDSIELIDKIEEAINLLNDNNTVVQLPNVNEVSHLLVNDDNGEETIIQTINNTEHKIYQDINERTIEQKNSKESVFTIENSMVTCSIRNKYGDKVFSDEGKLKYIGDQLYRLLLKEECFTIKNMHFDGSIWMKGNKKIVAYPNSELFRILVREPNFSNLIEDIVDSPVFKDCKLKVGGNWFFYNGYLITDTPTSKNQVIGNLKKEDGISQKEDIREKVKSPLYYERRQALIRALGFFRSPASVKDISRTISRTAWGAPIRETDVEEMLINMPEVEKRDDLFYLLGRR